MISAIAGLLRLDGAPTPPGASARMLALAARRRRDATSVWADGPTSLGCAVYAPAGSPAAPPQGPLLDAPTGCVCVADARLDNAGELLRRFGRAAPLAPPSPAEAILAAYLARGEGCAEEVAGEFSFAVWDPRIRTLLLARDRLGERPLNFHHAPGRLFAFASDPLALFGVEDVPFRVDEGRIADFLVDHALEGVDHTSTFYGGVARLPPARTLTVSPQGVRERRYWKLEAGPTLRLPSNEAYAEAFLDVFTQAVRSRLEGHASAGAMLSGGVDSGGAAAVAARVLGGAGLGPLHTFSGIGPDPESCAETRAALACADDPRLRAHTISWGDMAHLLPALEELAWSSDEPFEGYQTLLRAIYLTAVQEGVHHVFNGGGGDVVLGAGTCVAHLIRRGRLRAAVREARALDRFYGEHLPAPGQLVQGVRTAFIPESVRRAYHALREGVDLQRAVAVCLIAPELAERVALEDRFRRYRATRAPSDLTATAGANNGRYITSPDYTVGVEIYYRLAANLGVQPWDPFQDVRVVRFGVSLPGEQLLHEGWPKVILRRAMAGLLPDEVRWRRRPLGLGLAFTEALIRYLGPRLQERLEEGAPLLRPYVRIEEARRIWTRDKELMTETDRGRLFDLAVLAAWLERHRTRPVAPQASPAEGRPRGASRA